MKRKNIKILIIILCIPAFIFFSDFAGMFKASDSVIINIPVGSNPMRISKILKENSLIRHPYFFTAYSIVKDANFQAGTHTFKKMSYKDLFNELSNVTASESVNVTIPEGMEQREIALLLEKNGVCDADDFNNAAKIENFDSYWFLKDVPVREFQLEGYLFPDTYEFNINENPQNAIKKMLDNFDSKISKELKIKVDETNFTFDQIITLASIIEREAATGKDFKLVSGIFHNRMNYVGEGDGFFRSCATVQYILKERKNVLLISDTKIDSPYNTYLYEGLPVGPIASPGIKTIEAAVSPAKTDYVYFASDSSGKLYYAKTYSEHQNNMRKAGL